MKNKVMVPPAADFTLGQEVEWTSSSNGTTKTKQGQVEAVIPAGAKLTHEQGHEADAFGRPRDHTSYLVRVPAKTPAGKGKLYWPRTAALRPVRAAK